ncbi:MAG TPA: histidine kinase [Gaiellaceae bacterium]|nr:histidine kinase [Gaiellaceae bacterium]HKS79098.1 histidine kinase [Gaiellaceae bacterium]
MKRSSTSNGSPATDDADRNLSEQVLAAEQDERRRIALFLHDGPVQSLSGVALMLDASLDLIGRGDLEQAREILDRALGRTRTTVGELRDLSFNLEPVALRDHGFTAAVDALAQTRGREHRIEVSLDVAMIDDLGERTQAALYQIVREALEEAIRRGPPSRFEVAASAEVPGTLRLVIRDDAPTERRRRALEVLSERARTLGASLTLDHEADGTTMVLELRGQPTGD